MLARIRDTEIYFDIDGAGLVPDGPRMRQRPTAFIIHGGPGSDHSSLKAACKPLTEYMQLVYFDHRGQGRSARGDPAKYNLHENVEDLEALRLYLGLGPVALVGTSYGGMVAMAHAARHPQSVSHAILCVTAAHNGFIKRSREIVAQRGTPEQIAMVEDLYSGRLNTEEKHRHYYDVMNPLYSVTYDPVAALSTRERGIVSPAALNAAFGPGGFMHSYDIRPELANITAPTLILAGRHDWICAPEFSEEIHRLIPGSQLQILEQSSHSIRSDEPEKMLAAISAFIT